MTEAAKKEFTKGDFKPLPAGDYLVRMNRYEEAENRKGTGINGKASFEVVKDLEGQEGAKNRLIFENFVVAHTASPKAEEIGLSRLSNFLKAVGVDGGLDGIGNDRTQVEDFLEMPFIATLSIEEGSDYVAHDGTTKTSKDRNKITSFKRR